MDEATFLLALSAISGPILAVAATRVVDAWRERSRRRYEIFVALMATRRQALNNAHVEAINKIDVEFANDRQIISDLRKYMDILEQPNDGSDAQFNILMKRRRRAFATLIQSIGKKLGRRLDKNDFLEGGFYPQGWADFEDLQIQNMKELNAILSMKKPLWVMTTSHKPETRETNPASKYPEPPS